MVSKSFLIPLVALAIGCTPPPTTETTPVVQEPPPTTNFWTIVEPGSDAFRIEHQNGITTVFERTLPRANDGESLEVEIDDVKFIVAQQNTGSGVANPIVALYRDGSEAPTLFAYSGPFQSVRGFNFAEVQGDDLILRSSFPEHREHEQQVVPVDEIRFALSSEK